MFELRELERTDLPAINLWRQDPELISLLGAPYRYIGREIDEAWFNNYLKNRNSTIRCAIIEADRPDTILGLVTLSDINWIHSSCELHIMIGSKTNQNRGLGTFSVGKILDHAFDDLGLNRVELTVLASNKRAQHLYQKLGFKVEGTKKDAVYKSGAFQDLLMMAILKKDRSACH